MHAVVKYWINGQGYLCVTDTVEEIVKLIDHCKDKGYYYHTILSTIPDDTYQD